MIATENLSPNIATRQLNADFDHIHKYTGAYLAQASWTERSNVNQAEIEMNHIQGRTYV